MLKIEFRDNRQDPIWVMEKSFTIGSDKSSHLTLAHPSVAPSHARLVRQGEKFLLRDLNSESGTYVNGQRITQKHVACGDELRVGEVKLVIADPLADTMDPDAPYWSLIADASWLSGQEFPLLATPGQSVVLGRGNDCEIIFPGTHLSRRHAQITLGREALEVVDLNSANGTFLNDRKIDRAQVKAGDRLRFDVYSFRVFGPGIELSRSATTSQMPAITPPPESPAGERRWKTRPTSPGNREEPASGGNKLLGWLLAGVILAGFIALSYVILAG